MENFSQGGLTMGEFLTGLFQQYLFAGMDIGARIRCYRRARGLTQGELGDRVGRAQQDVHAWEIGKNRLYAEMVPKLAEALAIPVAAFFEDGGSAARAAGLSQH